ncbi:MAG: L-lactate permease [Nitrososphaeria archaeon]
MFAQILNPFSNLVVSMLVALIPIIVIFVMLAGLRISAWITAIVTSIITYILAVAFWHAPAQATLLAYIYGAATGFWAVDWIVIWGIIILNTMIAAGAMDRFKEWLVHSATADVRIQAVLIAWSFGALLEGLVGFGYPWAFVAPILMSLGVVDIEAIRVAALANNAPVSYGALGIPIIILAAVTGLPLMHVSAAVGRVVALLALAPPWILIYLVSGKEGVKEAWPLAIVGSLSYILGQFPVSNYVGPYLPDIAGSLVSFIVILIFIRYWKPKNIRGFGGKILDPSKMNSDSGKKFTASEVAELFMPFIVLIIVVVLGTGPWSPLPAYKPFIPAVKAISSITHKTMAVAFEFSPFVGGTFILISWIIIMAILRPPRDKFANAMKASLNQLWGAVLTGIFMVALADTFNYSGMAATLAYSFSKVGLVFIVLAPILGWIGVALSGSNTSTNAMFGYLQYSVGVILGLPPYLLPSLNSVGAEIGKPVAPQTASVGVSTSKYLRKEGEVIRHNMGWTLVILIYLIIIGLIYAFLLPGAMRF